MHKAFMTKRYSFFGPKIPSSFLLVIFYKKMIKNNILRKLENTYCRLKPSKLNGIGVFAIRDIPKNKNPFLGVREQDWYEFKTSDLKKLDKEIFKMIDDFFVIEKDNKVLIPEYGLNGMDISFFPNQSKKPNIKTINDGFSFITSRKIKKGEELTVSYSTYDWKYK